jgi:hypothetical protein
MANGMAREFTSCYRFGGILTEVGAPTRRIAAPFALA